jgi:isopentenyldiphosphate isomerase
MQSPCWSRSPKLSKFDFEFRENSGDFASPNDENSSLRIQTLGAVGMNAPKTESIGPMPATDSEMLYIVDERDRVIGQGERREIHRLGLRHRAVHVLVHNGAGELFLQLRADTKDSNPGLWDSSAAGHVNASESYEDCARREVREELGVDVSGLKRLLKIAASPQTGMEFCTVYRVAHEGPFRLDRNEIQAGQWVSPSDLDRWLNRGGTGLTQTFQVIWIAVREIFRGQKKTGAPSAAPD